jgi:hypothetical protein
LSENEFKCPQHDPLSKTLIFSGEDDRKKERGELAEFEGRTLAPQVGLEPTTLRLTDTL